ncbi:histidine phosphatase family protein [Nocardia sp. alder85J]|uniref:histidine phosphatase family protein n=1 Tax=Nocardia sp. alder85J TaxID=2862949 RepID=UPI001CD67244|nr:histidine phosphatase family protein [Nocardia sp. alder85J]MCX4092927.1 histidine phosphatase family protein [Nocardia sp. alder85J]
MSAVTRLTLVTHALTDAVRAARFPADESLDPQGLRAIQRSAGLPAALRPEAIRIGPEARTAETAAALGVCGAVEPALADLDCGRWAGAAMDAIPAESVAAWLTDPGFRGHGGESRTDLVDRVRAWLEQVAAQPQRILAVTHPAVVRACVLIALDAPAHSFWRVDVPPLSVTTLHHHGAWTLRNTACPL